MVKKLTQSQAELIRIVHELPPVKTLFFLNATEDQVDHYKANKLYWNLIGIGLKAYFSGESIEKSIEVESGFKPKKLLLLEILKWIRLYELLNFGWSHIESYLENTPYMMISTYGCNDSSPIPANPGDALRYMLELKSYYSFAQCLLPHYTFSPQTFYRDYKNWLKIQGKKNNKQPLTASELNTTKKLIAQTKSNSRNKYKEGEYILQHTLDILSKSKDKQIKKMLKEYLEITADCRDEHLKHFHPRKKIKGYSWSKGKLLTGKKGGYG